MLDHLNTFQCILNQLSRMNIKFEDEMHGLWVLGTLLDSWKIFTTSSSNSASNGVLSMDLVKSSVLNKEMKRKSPSSSQSDVLVTEKRESKSKGPQSNNKNKSRSGEFANVECHYCHKKGHIKKYCRKLKRNSKNHKGKEKKNDDDSDADTITIVTEDFYILMVML